MATVQSVFLFRCYCTTESIFVQSWSINAPTYCPNNNTHTIDASTIAIIDEITSSQVQVVPQVGTTGGEYRAESVSFTIPANSTGTYTNVWPYDISVKTVSFNSTPQQQGDIINSLIAPNTVVGVVTSSVSIGDLIIHCSPTVIANFKKGYLLSITDNNSTSKLGEVTDISSTTITCSVASTFAFAAGSVVLLTVNNIRDFVLGPAGPVHLQASGSTAAIIPANTVVLVVYKNNQSIDTVFNYNFEFFY